jgi:hypothetical protein
MTTSDADPAVGGRTWLRHPAMRHPAMRHPAMRHPVMLRSAIWSGANRALSVPVSSNLH